VCNYELTEPFTKCCHHEINETCSTRETYRAFVRRHEGNPPSMQSRLRSGDNIKKDLKEIRFRGLNQICLIQVRDE
jgi:hypothetical protein